MGATVWIKSWKKLEDYYLQDVEYERVDLGEVHKLPTE